MNGICDTDNVIWAEKIEVHILNMISWERSKNFKKDKCGQADKFHV